MKSLTILLLLVTCFFARAQSITVSNLAVDNTGKVSFRYAVSQKHSARESYILEVFSSADQFSKPLALNLAPVPAGETKNVSFDGHRVIGEHSGSLQFRFKAEATTFPVRITTTADKFKSGKNITISWEDFHDSGWYDIELYKDGLISKTLSTNYRGSILSTNLPKKMDKGTYEVRVTPTNRKELVSDDYPVTIAGAGGVGFIILGAGALTGAGILILGGKPQTDNALPDPPSPDGN